MLYTKEGFVSDNANRCNYTDCKKCNNNKFCRWNKINSKNGNCMVDKTKLIKAC